MGERNFGLDFLKSMNRDMEEKGIVFWELSCRTAAELPAPELPDCRQAPPRRTSQLRRQFSSRSTPAGAAGKLRRQFSSRSTLPELPDGFDGVVARRQSGSTAPGVQSLSPPCLLLRTATRLLSPKQSSRERDCTHGAELPPNSPRRNCSYAGPQNLSYALIGG